MRLARLLILPLLLLASPAFSQGYCPGNNTYLGWGEGEAYGINGCCHAWIDFSASFNGGLSGDGIAVCAGPFYYDADIFGQTCDPTTWNGTDTYYGTVTYDDGEIAYSGQARFWFDWVQAEQPYCNDTKSAQNNGTSVPRSMMVRRLKIQSCTNGHVLTTRFIATSTGCSNGTYCEANTYNPCNHGGYAHENWINMTISGF